MTALVARRRSTDRAQASRLHAPRNAARPTGLPWMLAAEVVGSVAGFLTLLLLARRLGPRGFADVEYGAAAAAWLLVLVRGGFDVVVYREAARRPRLIAPLTDVLLGLRALAAAAGLAVLTLLAVRLDPGRGAVVLLSGGLLGSAVIVADVGPRATGRLGIVAAGLVLRSLVGLALVAWLVGGPSDAIKAAGCAVAADLACGLLIWIAHARTRGPSRPRWRGRVSRVLARRGGIAGLTRFARVTLYGLDLLALGGWTGLGLGGYAAGRRLVYAALAIGLVVPSTLGPVLARRWAESPESLRVELARAARRLAWFALPVALGLTWHAERLLPWLLGADYAGAGRGLALVALRLPALLAAALGHATLTACRRETLSLHLTAAQLGLALLGVPLAAGQGGPLAVGASMLLLEWVGALAVWWALGRLGLVDRAAVPGPGVIAGLIVMLGVGAIAAPWPLPATLLASGLAYVAVAGHALIVDGRSSPRPARLRMSRAGSVEEQSRSEAPR